VGPLRIGGPHRYPATQPTVLRLSVGGEETAGGGRTYLRPKDSNAAVGVPDRATQKAREGNDTTDDRGTICALL